VAQTMSDFGIIIGCYQRDYTFARGTVASVRYYMPEVPICLLVDGAFPTDDLQRAYGVKPFYRADIKNDFLRERSFGWGLPKMVAFWESPFERFLFLDADTIVLGDIRPKLFSGPESGNWDLFIDKPRYGFDEKGVTKFFFDVPLLGKHFPNFPWRDYANRYYCTGVWAARRGIFDLKEYQAILEVKKSEPTMFQMAEMGFLNFMIFRGEAEGRLKVSAAEIQIIAPDFSLDELKKRWQIDRPPAALPAEEAAVLHYTSIKPTRIQGMVARPMTHFRAKALSKCGLPAAQSAFRMWKEDMPFDLRRWKANLISLIPGR
jgi:hypothetical protein